MSYATPEPQVTVVIPVHNGEQYVAEAVSSVLAQRDLVVECIVVDDGSTDRTPEILARFGAAIRYVRVSRAGVSSARNHGVSLARGRFVAFLDHDDYWMQDKLARQLYVMRASEADMVLCAMRILDSRHGSAPWADQQILRLSVKTDLVSGMLLFDGTELVSCSSTALVRRDVLLELDGFDPLLSASADWDLVLRFALERTVEYVDEPLVVYRVHDTNMSRSTPTIERDMMRAYAKAFAHPNLAPALAARRRLAYARLEWMLAGSYLQTGSVRRFALAIAKGIAAHPSFSGRLVARAMQALVPRRARPVRTLGTRAVELLGHRLARVGETCNWPMLIYNPVTMWSYHRLARRDAPAVMNSICSLFPELHRYADVGAGSGAFAAAAATLGLSVVACERSIFGRALARRQGVRAERFDLSAPRVVTPMASDLVYCFEVAEHMPAELGDRLVEYLVRTAPCIVFTAAQPGQGGYGHVNEQLPEYWVERFTRAGVLPDYQATERLKRLFAENQVRAPWLRANVLVFRESAGPSALGAPI